MNKKILAIMVAFTVMFGCSCSNAQKTEATETDVTTEASVEEELTETSDKTTSEEQELDPKSESETDNISSEDEAKPETETVEMTEKDQLLAYVNDILIPEHGEITDPDLTAKFYFEDNIYNMDDSISGYDIEGFEGQEGILGWAFADLDGDGDDSELIVLTRTKGTIKDFRDRDSIIWETSFEAFKVNGSDIVSMGTGLLESSGAEMFEGRVFIKHTSSGDEICTSQYGGGFYYYDGCSAMLVVYKYDGTEFSKIADAEYEGSDGFNEYGDFSDEAIKAQLLTTASFWKEYYTNWDFNVNFFLVPWDEPDCTDLLYTDTSSDLDYEILNALNDGTSDKTIDDYPMIAHVTNFMKGDTLDSAGSTQE